LNGTRVVCPVQRTRRSSCRRDREAGCKSSRPMQPYPVCSPLPKGHSCLGTQGKTGASVSERLREGQVSVGMLCLFDSASRRAISSWRSWCCRRYSRGPPIWATSCTAWSTGTISIASQGHTSWT